MRGGSSGAQVITVGCDCCVGLQLIDCCLHPRLPAPHPTPPHSSPTLSAADARLLRRSSCALRCSAVHSGQAASLSPRVRRL